MDRFRAECGRLQSAELPLPYDQGVANTHQSPHGCSLQPPCLSCQGGRSSSAEFQALRELAQETSMFLPLTRARCSPGTPDLGFREDDLNYFVAEFTLTGFRGGLNYYRNLDHRWELLRDVDPVITIPSAFVAGAENGHEEDANRLEATMAPLMSDLRFVRLIPNAGHHVQQEVPTPINEAILEFLGSALDL